MAKVKFYKGVEANLPTSGMVEDGAFYMCTDTGNMYLGSGTTTLIQLNQSPYYGSCATAAGEQTKVVTLNNASNFVLRIGTTIYVKFSNTNTYNATAAAPTKLNVANTGAKQIYGANTATPTGTSTTYFGRANYVNCYVYDGTYWVWNGSSQDNDGNNNVTQTATTTNANYEVLFSQTADNTTRTEQARKNSNLKFNPSTGDLQTTKLNGVTIGSSPKFTDTTYSAGTGLSLSGTTINHSNSVTAGTAGTSSATSGSTLSVPYVTYDAQGHVTASGTHTHTVDGFLPSSGGTITGDLTRKDTRIDASKADNNVTTTLYPTTFNVTDVSNRIITRKEAIVQSNGNISAFWYCRNYDTSGTMVAQKGIKITVNKAGTATYEVSDGANFRSAIGAGTVTSIATSGTGISGGTITSSGTITLDSSAEGNRAANKVVIAKAAGQINSEKWATTSSGTVKVTTQYNSTDASLDFIFA